MLIEEYLEDIFEQFKSEVNHMDDLCLLKDVNYKSRNIPDYSNKTVQLLYCLRYHFGYAFEYEFMYQQVLEEIEDKDEISVLSIGCGNGIDLWALQNAIKRRHQIIKINYYGIDSIDWRNKIRTRENDNIHYFQSDVSNLENIMQNLNNIDILIFPKSICELSQNDIENILNFISSKTNDIFVMASYRNNEALLIDDNEKTKKICEYLVNESFNITIGNPNVEYSFDDKSKGIRAIYTDYIYPNEAQAYIEHIIDKCDIYNENDLDCIECSSKISRKPILTLGNIHYNIIRLEKI